MIAFPRLLLSRYTVYAPDRQIACNSEASVRLERSPRKGQAPSDHRAHDQHLGTTLAGHARESLLGPPEHIHG